MVETGLKQKEARHTAAAVSTTCWPALELGGLPHDNASVDIEAASHMMG